MFLNIFEKIKDINNYNNIKLLDNYEKEIEYKKNIIFFTFDKEDLNYIEDKNLLLKPYNFYTTDEPDMGIQTHQQKSDSSSSFQNRVRYTLRHLLDNFAMKMVRGLDCAVACADHLEDRRCRQHPLSPFQLGVDFHQIAVLIAVQVPLQLQVQV